MLLLDSHPSRQSLRLKCLLRCCSLWKLPAEKDVACHGIVMVLSSVYLLVAMKFWSPVSVHYVSHKILLTLFLRNLIRCHLASLTRQLIMLAGRRFRDFGNIFSTLVISTICTHEDFNNHLNCIYILPEPRILQGITWRE
jgi:hypothetical protein